MVRRIKGKSILDLFRRGKEIDAAVRRAVRQAVGKPSTSRKHASERKTSRRPKAA